MVVRQLEAMLAVIKSFLKSSWSTLLGLLSYFAPTWTLRKSKMADLPDSQKEAWRKDDSYFASYHRSGRFLVGCSFFMAGFVVCSLLAKKYAPELVFTLPYEEERCHVQELVWYGHVNCSRPKYSATSRATFPCVQVVVR